MSTLEIDVHPEPDADVAAALVDAVGRAAHEDGLLDPPAGARSAWRRAGAREAVDPPAQVP